MFRSAVEYSLCLTLLPAVGTLAAQEAEPTLKELTRRASEEPKAELSLAVNFAVRPHTGPGIDGQSNLLVITWYRDNAYFFLRYTVSETGKSHSRRTIYNYATQATIDEQLSAHRMRLLSDLLPALPESKAEPPIERTVLISFQSGDKWRTETYDAARLPDEIEQVMLIIGERSETAARRRSRVQAHWHYDEPHPSGSPLPNKTKLPP